jgi:hypothetical protein
MLRRALLCLLPAVLALAFLTGTPGASDAAPAASTAASRTDAQRIPIIRGSLTQEIPDGSLSQHADEDDPDDRVVRVGTKIQWGDAALRGRVVSTADIARPSHPPGADRPRAPPAL